MLVVFLLKSSFSRSENPLLESRGEHIFVHTGMQAYIKISRSFYSALDREEDPCVDAEEHYGESSYGEVRRETGRATFFCSNNCMGKFLSRAFMNTFPRWSSALSGAAGS